VALACPVVVGVTVGNWKKVRVGVGSGGSPPHAASSGMMSATPSKRRRLRPGFWDMIGRSFITSASVHDSGGRA
jgi:hypothetical protein